METTVEKLSTADSSNETSPTPTRGNDMEKPSPQLDPTALDTTRNDWNSHDHLAYTVMTTEKQGLPPPSSNTSVLFRDLRVVGSGAGANYQAHVGQILEAPSAIAHLIKTRGRSPQKEILHGIDGVVRAGEMLLVLGRPGSGCTTMLKTLAGFTEGYVGWSGDVAYNGVDVEIMKKQFRGDILYNAEGESCLIVFFDPLLSSQSMCTFPLSLLATPSTSRTRCAHLRSDSTASLEGSTSKQLPTTSPKLSD